MLGSESAGDSRPQNPSSLRAGIKHGVERAGKRYPTPGLYAPGGMVNLPQKQPDADKGGSPAQDRTWGSAGAGGARPSTAGGRDTGP